MTFLGSLPFAVRNFQWWEDKGFMGWDLYIDESGTFDTVDGKGRREHNLIGGFILPQGRFSRQAGPWFKQIRHAQDHVQLFHGGAARAVDGGVQLVKPALGPALADRLQHAVLRVKIVVEAALGHLQGAENVLHRGAVIALLEEQLLGGIQNLHALDVALFHRGFLLFAVCLAVSLCFASVLRFPFSGRLAGLAGASLPCPRLEDFFWAPGFLS